MKYVAKFTELAHFTDDYVASDMAKVRKFEDSLKLSIWEKIVGFSLQDLESMVKTAMAIESEVDDARSIWEAGAKDKKKQGQSSSSSSGKRQRTFTPQGQIRGYQGQGQGRSSQGGEKPEDNISGRSEDMFPLPPIGSYEAGLPSESGIPEL